MTCFFLQIYFKGEKMYTQFKANILHYRISLFLFNIFIENKIYIVYQNKTKSKVIVSFHLCKYPRHLAFVLNNLLNNLVTYKNVAIFLNNIKIKCGLPWWLRG